MELKEVATLSIQTSEATQRFEWGLLADDELAAGRTVKLCSCRRFSGEEAAAADDDGAQAVGVGQDFSKFACLRARQ